MRPKLVAADSAPETERKEASLRQLRQRLVGFRAGKGRDWAASMPVALDACDRCSTSDSMSTLHGDMMKLGTNS